MGLGMSSLAQIYPYWYKLPMDILIGSLVFVLALNINSKTLIPIFT